MKLSIIGGGSWGTALSIVLAPRFEQVRMWMFESDLAAEINASRENRVYLPGIPLPAHVSVGTDLKWAVEGADFVLGVMPSRHARVLYEALSTHFTNSMTLVSATKGIETSSLLRISEIGKKALSSRFEPRIVVLSGPTFAREVALGEPAAVVVASQDSEAAIAVQQAFAGPTFRLYTNDDVIGVEVGAALKNVIAIGAGVCQGLGLGNNTLAALITRGLAEITRLAVAMGGQPKTLAGLAGLGDLVLTCSGDLSRNRKVGKELARGAKLEDILSSMPMVAEGVETCDAAVALGAKYGISLPIIEQMYCVLHQAKSPRQAIQDLMDRSLKGE